jgi:hypothetical protein
MTGEDCWPLWLGRQYESPTYDGWWTGSSHTIDGPGFPTRSRKLKLKLTIVCGRCNNRWMSDLETRARPLLLPLIKSSRDNYDFSDQAVETLVEWMLKMAMVWEYARPRKPKMFGLARSAAFRGSRTPPTDVSIGIWLARRHRPPNDNLTHANIRTAIWLTHPPAYAAAPEFYRIAQYILVTTFSIDQLVFQVVAKRGWKAAPIDFAGFDLPGILYRLWPRSHYPQRWPTRFDLVEANLRDLARRFPFPRRI